MTPTTQDLKETFLLQDRLADLGVLNRNDRDLLLARLRRERLAGESLQDAYTRSLCRWFSRWLERLGETPLREGPAALAAAEAAVALSGLGERWPLALLDAATSLPPEARRRLKAALPVATPATVVRSMPAQQLEPVGLTDLLPLPARSPAPTRLKA